MKRRQAALLIALSLTSCRAAIQGSNDRSRSVNLPATLRFAVTDVPGLEMLEAEYDAFRAALADALGVEVEFVPVNNVGEATLLLQQNRIHCALAGPSEYVQIRARTNAQPVIALTRPDYYSVIAVSQESEIGSLSQLKNRSIALSDIGSTSGHIGPFYILIQAGLQPQEEIDIQMLGDDGSAAAVKSGDLDAWGGSATDFEELVQSDEKPFRILKKGDPLPSDIFVASSGLAPEQVTFLQEKMIAAQDRLIAAIAVHHSKYAGSSFETVLDEDYDSIRRVYAEIGEGEFAP